MEAVLPTAAAKGSGATERSAWPDWAALSSIITHDLRNPLNALSGWLQILGLDEASLSAVQRRSLAGAQAALAQQTQQLERVTRVLQLYGGRERLQVAPLDWDQVLDQVGCELARRVGGSTQSVAWAADDANEGTARQVWGDAWALQQALSAIGAYGLASAPARAQLRLSPGRAALPSLVMSIDAATPEASIWAALQPPIDRMSLELLEALLRLRAMGAQLRVLATQGGRDLLEMVWIDEPRGAPAMHA